MKDHKYKVCSMTVMDTTSSLIKFDEQGVSNYVHDFKELASQTIHRDKAILDRELEQTIHKLKKYTSPDGYNCLLGLSGGVDSTYLAHLCDRFDIKPLCVHFDNGWNSNIAVSNIYSIINKLDFDLETFVIDWEEFKDIQLAYFKASVLDLEVPTDQFIFGAMNHIARKKKIKYVLSGNNIATESILPKDWRYDKFDLINLKAIHKQYGSQPLGNIPKLGKKQSHFNREVLGLEMIYFLNLIPYGKKIAIDEITRELDWKNYGGKHHESIFTRWFQGNYLPKKFGIDKRKAHLSNLILNNEITREEALEELQQPTYPEHLQKEDDEYVAKKWGLSEKEFKQYFEQNTADHLSFPNDKTRWNERSLFLYKKLAIPFLKTIYSRL